MTKSKTYKSEALAAIHETATDMYAAGLLDKKTMRRFDESCLTPIHKFTPDQIRALRQREQVSQTVFAYHLNISKESVSGSGAKNTPEEHRLNSYRLSSGKG